MRKGISPSPAARGKQQLAFYDPKLFRQSSDRTIWHYEILRRQMRAIDSFTGRKTGRCFRFLSVRIDICHTRWLN
jgi:hypothetical protein